MWLQFTWDLVRRDFRMRYAGSALGWVWNVVIPLGNILTYVFLFSIVFRQRAVTETGPRSYATFLCAGLLPWIVFSEAIVRFTSIYQEHANLLKRLPVPKLALLLFVVASAEVSLVIYFGLLSIVVGLGWLGGSSLPAVLCGLLFAPFQLLLMLGLGMTLSLLGVFVRDVRALLPIGLQLLFWLTPICYQPQAIPERMRGLFHILWLFNPFYGVARCYQDIIVSCTFPSADGLVHVACWIVVSLGLGAALMRANGANLVDSL